MPIAFLTASDKTHLTEFGRGLTDLDYDLIASGGTASTLRAAGLNVQEVAEITGVEPILDRGVVTINHKIAGGVLALPTPEHRAELRTIGAPFIDLVYVDPYPFHVALLNGGDNPPMESYDIGGSLLLTSAVKRGKPAVCD